MITNTDFLTKKYFTKRVLTKRQKWIYYPPPPEFFEICGQLLRYCEKINPQRIKDTPPVNFFLCLVLASPISKKDYFKNIYCKKQTEQLFLRE